MLGELRELYGYGNVQPSPRPSIKPSREIRFEIDRVRAADLEIDVATLGTAVEAMVDGIIIGDYRLGGEAIDIVVRSGAGREYSPDELARLPLAYRTQDAEAGSIPLSEVATTHPQRCAPADHPYRRTPIGHPQRDPALTTVPLELAEGEIRALEARLRSEQGGRKIGTSVGVDYAGSASKLQEVRTALAGKWDGANATSFRSIAMSRLFIALPGYLPPDGRPCSRASSTR